VGGDLYIYHQFAPDATAPAVHHYALAVGDVSGKGMPAALLMSACMASFRSLVGQTLAPGTFLMHMDSAIGEYTRFTRQNCAMVYLNIVIAPETGRTLRVANAGCIVPMIKRTSGELIWVNVGGIPLGVGLGAKSGYQEAARQLLPGDMVILTSDGVVEARNAEGALFGFERLAQTVCSGPAGSAVALVQHIRSAVQSFVGDALLADDMTIVVIQV
jgi:sigma-B regulation protein RsbU (phosphoserine phosphatase)